MIPRSIHPLGLHSFGFPADFTAGMKRNGKVKIVDGNSRAYELIDRANDSSSSINPNTTVPVESYDSVGGIGWDWIGW